LRSYELTPDLHAQSMALAAILSDSSNEETAVPSAAARVGRRITPREAGWLSWERLAEVFSIRPLRPAHVATLALLLIATALGLRWLAGSHTSDATRQPDSPASANTNSQPIRSESAAKDLEKRSKDSDAVDGPTIHQAKARRYHHTSRQRREGLSGEVPQEMARTGTHALRPSSESAAPYTSGSLSATAADPSLRIGRHAERVERLLRSFRNARLTDKDLPLEVADARRLSKRLLYSNIALRREAAGAGDLPVEGLLDSLEPILLDISNLPDRPSPDAVGSIKERIRRRQLVGVLQAQAMLASKP
jgi:hypothetical protein